MTNKKLEKLAAIKDRKAELEGAVDEVLAELDALEGEDREAALSQLPAGFAERDDEGKREVLREFIRRFKADQDALRAEHDAYVADFVPTDDYPEPLEFDDWADTQRTDDELVVGEDPERGAEDAEPGAEDDTDTDKEADVADVNTEPGEQPAGIDVTAAGPSGDGDTAHEQAAPFAETKIAAAEAAADLEAHEDGDGQTGNENVNVDSPAEHADQPTAGEVDVPQDPAVSDVIDPHPDIAPIDDKPEAIAEDPKADSETSKE